MDIKLPDNLSLPNWSLVFAFFASLILSLIKLCEILFNTSKLEIVLTREMFYRLLDRGEVIYSNAVLVAHNSGAMIQDIKVKLTQKGNRTNRTKITDVI